MLQSNNKQDTADMRQADGLQNDTLRTKQQWRAHFKHLRSEIPASERQRIDAAIANHVGAMPVFSQASLLCAYLSFGAEVETRGIIQAAWSAGKQVALPRCVPNTRTMRWYTVRSFDGLVKSPLGVEEPAEDPTCEVEVSALDTALVLVPGLTFDARGYRMGYGGGFYDVFLEHFAGTSVGLCRACQLSGTVPALDGHDLPVDFVITEEGQAGGQGKQEL